MTNDFLSADQIRTEAPFKELYESILNKVREENCDVMQQIFNYIIKNGGVRRDIFYWLNDHFISDIPLQKNLSLLLQHQADVEWFDLMWKAYQECGESRYYYTYEIVKGFEDGLSIDQEKELFEKCRTPSEMAFMRQDIRKKLHTYTDTLEDRLQKILEEVYLAADKFEESSKDYHAETEKVEQMLEDQKNIFQEQEQKNNIQLEDLKVKLLEKEQICQQLNHYLIDIQEENEMLKSEIQELNDRLHSPEDAAPDADIDQEDTKSEIIKDQSFDTAEIQHPKLIEVPKDMFCDEKLLFEDKKEIFARKKGKMKFLSLLFRKLEQKNFKKLDDAQKTQMIIEKVIKQKFDQERIRIIAKLLDSSDVGKEFIYSLVVNDADVNVFQSLYYLANEMDNSIKTSDLGKENTKKVNVLQVDDQKDKNAGQTTVKEEQLKKEIHSNDDQGISDKEMPYPSESEKKSSPLPMGKEKKVKKEVHKVMNSSRFATLPIINHSEDDDEDDDEE